MVEGSTSGDDDYGTAGDYTKPVLHFQPPVRHCDRGCGKDERSEFVYGTFANTGLAGIVSVTEGRTTVLYSLHSQYNCSDPLLCYQYTLLEEMDTYFAGSNL